VLLFADQKTGRVCAKLADFGLSLMKDAPSRLGEARGTRIYMAPEVIDLSTTSPVVGVEVDYWAVSMMFANMCIGEHNIFQWIYNSMKHKPYAPMFVYMCLRCLYPEEDLRRCPWGHNVLQIARSPVIDSILKRISDTSFENRPFEEISNTYLQRCTWLLDETEAPAVCAQLRKCITRLLQLNPTMRRKAASEDVSPLVVLCRKLLQQSSASTNAPAVKFELSLRLDADRPDLYWKKTLFFLFKESSMDFGSLLNDCRSRSNNRQQSW
jgi:serine/threonine protein kinase